MPSPSPPLLNKSVIPQEILAEEGENLQIMSLSAAHKGDVDSILLSIYLQRTLLHGILKKNI
jgi:hypothetical protein